MSIRNNIKDWMVLESKNREKRIRDLEGQIAELQKSPVLNSSSSLQRVLVNKTRELANLKS